MDSRKRQTDASRSDHAKQANAELCELNEKLQTAYSQIHAGWDQFRSILNGIPQVIFVADLENSEILFANECAKELMGRDITGDLCSSALYSGAPPSASGPTPDAPSEDIPRFWEHYDARLDRHFYIMDRKIRWTDDRIARFRLAIDLTERVEAERQIRKNEEMLRIAHESANIGIMYVTGEGKIIYANHASSEIFGYPAQELASMTVNDISVPEDKEVSKKFIETALKERARAAGSFVKSYYHKEGHIITCEITSALLHDNDGKPLHFVSHIKDITKQKKAEEELRASEERYRLITENASDVIWVLNIARECFTYISPSVFDLRGYTPEEAMRQDIDHSLTPESAQLVRESVELNLSKFLADPAGFSKKVFVHELKQLRKDGTTVWVETTTRYQFNPKGEVEVIGISRNIQERKKQQQRIETHLRYEKNIAKFSNALLRNEPGVLKASLAHLREAADCAQVGLFQHSRNPDGSLFARPLAQSCKGGHPGDTDRHCFPEISYTPGGLQRWLHAFQQKETIEGQLDSFPTPEREILLKKGIRSMLMIPVWSENRLFGFIGFFDTDSAKQRSEDEVTMLGTVAEVLGLYFENQTARQRLLTQNSQLNHASATKDRFISILAHDLRDPFSALFGLSDFLLESLESLSQDEIKESVEMMRSSSQKTYNLLESLLDWSQNQQGLIALNPQPQNLKSLLRESCEVLIESARAKKIDLNFELADSLSLRVDKDLFKAITRNLLSNAIKFTRSGGEITFSARREAGTMVIQVKDNGVGMSKERVASLFRIEKIRSTRGTSGEQGTGFGLLLCKEFIEKHGGTLSVESKPNVGSCFTIVLPEVTTGASGLPTSVK
ncbi:MAG: PAS domain S-box protein [Opitutales bacterium]|nr:PAS domain S-box protein [Opitutales bacterium]